MPSVLTVLIALLLVYLARWIYTSDRRNMAADMKSMFLALGVVTIPSLVTGHTEWLLATVPLTPVAFNMIRYVLRPSR